MGTFNYVGPVRDVGTGNVPTVSEWGLSVLALSMLIAATLVFIRHRVETSTA